ncbi:MAG: type 1 glutamine amidotransferase [Actinomycetes bacterium]
MRALFVHHDPNSTVGVFGAAFARRGIEVVEHLVCATPRSPVGSTEFPDPELFDVVVVLGSRWGITDPECAHWVVPEQVMLRRADAAGVPVLGCCFGGQVLAAALGGAVGPAARPEIGWLEVGPQPVAPPNEGMVHPGPWLQWHGDAFSVPPGATELARTEAGPQAFVLRRCLGLQFHPEVDRAVLEAWLVDDADELLAVGLDPQDLVRGADRHGPDAAARAHTLVDRFLDDVAQR